jgi:hypothetical protein
VSQQQEACEDDALSPAERCPRQLLSLLVPLGQQMACRYQEALIADLLYVLRAFYGRLGPHSVSSALDFCADYAICYSYNQLPGRAVICLLKSGITTEAKRVTRK